MALRKGESKLCCRALQYSKSREFWKDMEDKMRKSCRRQNRSNKPCQDGCSVSYGNLVQNPQENMGVYRNQSRMLTHQECTMFFFGKNRAKIGPSFKSNDLWLNFKKL